MKDHWDMETSGVLDRRSRGRVWKPQMKDGIGRRCVLLKHFRAGVSSCQMGLQRRLWTLRPTCLECTSGLSTVASCGLRTLKSLAVDRPSQTRTDLTSSLVAVVPVMGYGSAEHGVCMEHHGTVVLVMFLTL